MNCTITPQKGLFLNKILYAPEIIISSSTKTIIQQINPTHTCLSNLVLEDQFFETISTLRPFTIRLSTPKMYCLYAESISLTVDCEFRTLKMVFGLVGGDKLTRVYYVVEDILYEIEFRAVYFPFPRNFYEVLRRIADSDVEIEIGNRLVLRGNNVKIHTDCITGELNNDIGSSINFDKINKDEMSSPPETSADNSFKGIISVTQLKNIFSKAENFYSITYGCDGDNINFNFEGDGCLWSVFMTI